MFIVWITMLVVESLVGLRFLVRCFRWIDEDFGFRSRDEKYRYDLAGWWKDRRNSRVVLVGFVTFGILLSMGGVVVMEAINSSFIGGAIHQFGLARATLFEGTVRGFEYIGAFLVYLSLLRGFHFEIQQSLKRKRASWEKHADGERFPSMDDPYESLP